MSVHSDTLCLGSALDFLDLQVFRVFEAADRANFAILIAAGGAPLPSFLPDVDEHLTVFVRC